MPMLHDQGVRTRFMLLYLPWPKGAPTNRSAVAGESRDFDAERARCRELTGRFASRPGLRGARLAPSRTLMLVGCLLASSLGPRTLPAQSSAVPVTHQQFRQLQWLTGTWRGSGGTYSAFFEQYRVLDDSTLQMRAFPDSTFRQATDSSTIEWRNGTIQSRSGRSTYIVIELTPASIRFIGPGAVRGGHTFARVTADEWTATLHPATEDGSPTIYTMRRARPSR
jgi:hypothetical protein